MALAAGAGVVLAPMPASMAATLDEKVQALTAGLAAANARLTELEAKIGELAATAKITRDSLARELAQPVLLLVGEGKCPAGFDRIQTEVLLLSGPRTAKNSELLDRAGLADDEQVGVGSRVYRYLDFCFRAANTVTVK